MQEIWAVLLRMATDPMPAWGAHCVPLFFSFAIFAGIQFPSPAIGQAARLPAVIAQNYDDDCGLAAVRMLLERAGLDITEHDLLANLNEASTENALSAADLSDMVRGLGKGLELDIGWLPPNVLPILAQREPFLVLMRPRSFDGADGFDHFIIVEGQSGDGYTVSDPILASRSQLSGELLRKDSHQKNDGSRDLIMVLRLKTATGAPALLPLNTIAQMRRWEQSYRLPRVLPNGKIQVSVSAVQQRQTQAINELDVTIDDRSTATIATISRGIGHRSQFNLSATRFTGNGSFRLSGEALDFRQDAKLNVAVAIEHIPNIQLPPSMGLFTSATLDWEKNALPSAITLGAQLGWVKGRLTSTLGIDARYEGQLAAAVYPAISYRLPIRQSFVFEATIAAPFRIGGGQPQYEAEFSVGKRIGLDWYISAVASTGLWQSAGMSSKRLGVTVTYGIPRRFRKAALPFQLQK